MHIRICEREIGQRHFHGEKRGMGLDLAGKLSNLVKPGKMSIMASATDTHVFSKLSPTDVFLNYRHYYHSHLSAQSAR